LAAVLQPPATPWWFRRPLGYREFFTDPAQPAEDYSGLYEHFEDVLLAQARYRDDQKRAKLIEEVFTNPSPDMAGRAVEELRWMENEGRRA
jgi:hypothetical protein